MTGTDAEVSSVEKAVDVSLAVLENCFSGRGCPLLLGGLLDRGRDGLLGRGRDGLHGTGLGRRRGAGLRVLKWIAGRFLLAIKSFKKVK